MADMGREALRQLCLNLNGEAEICGGVGISPCVHHRMMIKAFSATRVDFTMTIILAHNIFLGGITFLHNGHPKLHGI